jgi:hypothetical protein
MSEVPPNVEEPIEEVSLDELEAEFEQSQKEKQKAEVLNGVHEEVEIDVIDVAVTRTGVLIELYTSIGEVYVYNLDDTARDIMSRIENGKLLRIKAVRLKGYKRLARIDDVQETKKVKLMKNHVLMGTAERIGASVRIVSTEGKRYYVSEGTLNYEKLAKLVDGMGTSKVLLIASQVMGREGQRGTYYLVRGLYIVKPKPSEVKEEKKEVEEIEPSKIEEEGEGEEITV